MHAQDCRLRWVDDGRAEHGAKHSTVADGERTTVHVLHGQLVFASLKHTEEDITVNALCFLVA